MNNQTIKIKVRNFYVPYIFFPELEVDFKKTIEIDEMSAILFSYIFDLENNESKKYLSFFDDLFKTFNLEKNKWQEFFKKILESKWKNGEIIIDPVPDKIDDDYLLCGDVSLHKSIKLSISKKEFVGLDSKSDKRNVYFNKILYEDLKIEKKHIFLQELISLKNKLKNEDNIIKTWNKENKNIEQIIWDEENNLINNLKLQGGKYTIFKIKIGEKREIRYIKLENVELEIKFTNDNEIQINSNSIQINNIIDKYNEKQINEIVIWSIENSILSEIKNNDIKEMDEEIIKDINEYENIFNQIKENKEIFNFQEENRAIYIEPDTNKIYQIGFKKIKTKINNEESKPIKLLTRKYMFKLEDLILKEIKEYQNYKVINLIEKLSNDETQNINYHLINKWTDPDYMVFKNYIITNLLKDEKINNTQIKESFELDLFTIEDFNLLMKQNYQQYKSFINDGIKIKESTNKNLSINKMKEYINKYQIDWDRFLNVFENQYVDKIKDVIKKTEELKETHKKIEYWQDFDLEIKKIEKDINGFDEYTKKNIEDPYLKELKLIVEQKKELNDERLKVLKIELLNKLFDFENEEKKLTLIDFENKIKDKDLKSKFTEIRIYRNKNIAHKGKSEQQINVDKNKLKEEIYKIKGYIKWLTDNKEKLLNSIKKQENKKEK